MHLALGIGRKLAHHNIKITVAQKAAGLGADRGSNLRARPKAAARRAAAWKQVSKTRELICSGRAGRRAARRVIHRGCNAKVQYGAAVYGVSPSAVQSWRRAIGGAFASSVRGR
eukprot:4369783-Pyramimonas_sp.AAC.2